MKKFQFYNSLILMALVALGLSSCKHDLEYDENTPNNAAVEQYKADFEAKYGKVSPNATWDFSEVKSDVDIRECKQPELQTPAKARRAVSSAATPRLTYGLSPNEDIQITVLERVQSLNELAYIRQNAASLEVKPWTDAEAYGVNDLWVWYVHGFAGQDEALADVGGVATYSLGIFVDEEGTGSYNAGTEYYTSLPIMGSAISNNWFYGYGNGYIASAVGQRIDASALKDKYKTVFWYAMVDDGTPTPADYNEYRAKWELKSYKECVTPAGAVYWLFDCNHDGDYTDLVCLVEPVEKAKRYMIEDLGSIGDFDFNDVVVDVFAAGDNQWAIVRALGGTLDITIKIGNTTWSKAESGLNVGTIYNTQPPIDFGAELARFDVTGWDADANNISVTVRNQRSTVPQVIPFPKRGEVPMIIAMPTSTNWMEERVSIPESWFTEE